MRIVASQPPSLFYLPFRPALDANGIVAPGAKLFFYLTQTAIPQKIYANASLTVELENPVGANAAGVWPSIYMDPTLTYRVVLKDQDGVVLNEVDPYRPGVVGEGEKGDTGPANSTYTTLADFQAADITNVSANYDGSPWFFDRRDYTGLESVDVVKADSTPLTIGAWVRGGNRDTVYVNTAAGATAAQNLAAWKVAVAQVRTGGRIIDTEKTYSIDTLGGLSNAVKIDRKMTIQVDATMRGNMQCTNAPAVNGVDVSGDLRSNPPYIFNVSADDVSFVGNGTVGGNGTFNDQNFGDPDGPIVTPGLIYVTGDRFIFDGPTISDPPKVGIYLDYCDDAVITCKGRGGPVTYNEGVGEGVGSANFPHTALFYVKPRGGSYHEFTNCDFDAGGLSGGKATSCIFSTATHITVRGCYGRPHEKLVYSYAPYATIESNTIEGAHRTDAIRVNGSFNTVRFNIGRNCKGLITAYDGHDNTITDNQGYGLQQTAINVQRLTSYTGGFDRNKVNRNTLIADPASTTRNSGIVGYFEGSNTTTGQEVIGNIVVNFAPDMGQAIQWFAVAPTAISAPVISGNKTSNSVIGINLLRALNATVQGNQFDSMTYPIITNGGAGGQFTGNRGAGGLGQIGINGYSSAAGDVGQDNRWTDDPLTFPLTMTAGTSTVSVTKTFIAPNARVEAVPDNDAALLSVAANGAPRVSVIGQTVTIAHATGNNATSDQLYIVKVIQ